VDPLPLIVYFLFYFILSLISLSLERVSDSWSPSLSFFFPPGYEVRWDSKKPQVTMLSLALTLLNSLAFLSPPSHTDSSHPVVLSTAFSPFFPGHQPGFFSTPPIGLACHRFFSLFFTFSFFFFLFFFFFFFRFFSNGAFAQALLLGA